MQFPPFVRPIGSQQGYGSKLPHAPYKNVSGAVLWAWRPGHWANWAFELNEQTADEAAQATFTFAKGGFQGGQSNRLTLQREMTTKSGHPS